MPRCSLSLELLNILEGSYKPREDELSQIAKIAKLNKLYLAFLRSVDSTALWPKRLLEETKFRSYRRNVVDVVNVLRDLRYTLYKFRKPVDHVSVDLDILIHPDDVSKAITRLRSIGFVIDIIEPYTATLKRKGFIVDLYTYPAFAWIIYMDGQKLISDYSEDIEIDDTLARSLTKDAEVVVTAAHAVYKEHIVLLLDCLTITKWFSKRTMKIAEEFTVMKALETVSAVCRAIEQGIAESPYKIPLTYVARLYLEKMAVDPLYRATSLNIMKYFTKRKYSMHIALWKLTRKSY